MRLEARNVSFRYDNGNRNILNHMDLTLESGERLGLAAPSGFGKTTFLKILAGYETPDEGGVYLDGLLSGADDLAAPGAGGEPAAADGRGFK